MAPRMTSPMMAMMTCFGLLSVRVTSASYDHTVCIPSIPTVPLPVPAASLGQVWQAVIEWKDDVKNRTYVIKDYADMPSKQEKLVISIPLRDDVTVLYDWNTLDVTVEETMHISPTESRQFCRVMEHSNDGDIFALADHFWLTPLQVLMTKFVDSRDAILNGTEMVRGIRAVRWTACVYDYYKNVTAVASLYFSDKAWLSPYLPPNSPIPVRMQYRGRQHNGSDVSEVRLTGDILSFRKRDLQDRFPPDTFTTQSGAFCPGRTGLTLRLPPFPPQLSLEMERVDTDFRHISYQRLWYDRALQKVRWDAKSSGSLSNFETTSYIMDFRSGVQYLISRYTMSCEDSLLQPGMDFTTVWPNGSLSMMTTGAYFHADKANIQYVGQVTVRSVVCDTWIGQYYDAQTNRNNTVQWYFTTREWLEATGNVEGGGAFFMMKVWEGGSGKPAIFNVLRYSPSAPDFTVFDYSPCFKYTAKKHFTIEFQVSSLQTLEQLGSPGIRQAVVQRLAARLDIDLNRFTAITVDADRAGGSLFLSATLLEAIQGSGQPQVSLQGAFLFLRGSIDASHLTFTLLVQDTNVTITGISLVEHNFRQEFATTTTTPPPTTKIVAPTLVPPKKPTPALHSPSTSPTPTTPTHTPSSSTPPCPSATPCPTCPPPPTCPLCTTPSSTPCPPPRVAPSQAQACSCQATPSTCPPPPTCPPPSTCPPPPTCPPPSACPARRSCAPCAGSTAQACTDKQATSGLSISTGGLAGAVIAALVLGLALGVIATRLFHITRASPDRLTINLVEDI